MYYLLANVIFASMFTLCIKWVQVRGREDILTVGAINYIVAAVLTMPDFLSSGVDRLAFSALWTGGLMGACYFVAFFFVNRAIKYIGASNTTVIAVLSILVPIAFGILVWNEQPNRYQIIGMVLALLALILIGGKTPGPMTERRLSSGHGGWLSAFILTSFFLLAGLSRLAQEAFKHVSTSDQRPVFLLTAFTVATIPSVALLLIRRRRLMPIEFGFGFMMGASNILQTHFILKSLQYFDGFVVFLVVSAGSLTLTTVVSTGALGERLNRRSQLGIATAIVALILLNTLSSQT